MSFCTGKSVCLIGPAEHVSRVEQADHVKSFDVVVRLNDAFPMPAAVARCTSERCEVLYIRRHLTPQKEWKRLREIRLEPRALWRPDSRLKEYAPWQDIITIYHPRFERPLHREIGCLPNLGTIAITEILSENPARLYVTGITFFQTPYYTGYTMQGGQENADRIFAERGNVQGHDSKLQLDFIRKNFKGRFEADEVLAAIL